MSSVHLRLILGTPTEALDAEADEVLAIGQEERDLYRAALYAQGYLERLYTETDGGYVCEALRESLYAVREKAKRIAGRLSEPVEWNQ